MGSCDLFFATYLILLSFLKGFGSQLNHHLFSTWEGTLGTIHLLGLVHYHTSFQPFFEVIVCWIYRLSDIFSTICSHKTKSSMMSSASHDKDTFKGLFSFHHWIACETNFMSPVGYQKKGRKTLLSSPMSCMKLISCDIR